MANYVSSSANTTTGLTRCKFGPRDCTTAAILTGSGTSTLPVLNGEIGKNFHSSFCKTTSTSGTTRGRYDRLYLGATGTACGDGEAGRFFTTIVGNCVANSGVHGVHVSTSFASGASNGGSTAAVRATFQAPNAVIGAGTYTAVYAELYGDGASTDVTGATSISFARFVQGGTYASAKDKNINFITVEGVTAGADYVYRVAAPTTLAASLRCKVNGVVYYLPLYSAQA